MRDSCLKTLEKAFFNDPLFEFFWPEEQERSRKMGPVLEFFLKAASWVFTLESPGGGCVAVVGACGPGQYPPSFRRVLFVAPTFVKMMVRLWISDGIGILRQFMSIYSEAEKIRPKGTYWYVVIIGVDPEQQGKNFGGKLLGIILRKADEQKIPVYLECSNPRSMDFYARHGFCIKHEVRPCEGGPPIWGVERMPSPIPENQDRV